MKMLAILLKVGIFLFSTQISKHYLLATKFAWMLPSFRHFENWLVSSWACIGHPMAIQMFIGLAVSLGHFQNYVTSKQIIFQPHVHFPKAYIAKWGNPRCSCSWWALVFRIEERLTIPWPSIMRTLAFHTLWCNQIPSRTRSFLIHLIYMLHFGEQAYWLPSRWQMTLFRLYGVSCATHQSTKKVTGSSSLSLPTPVTTKTC